MSVKVMGWIWDMELPQDEKLVALAYADHAHHDGTNIFPAVSSVAKKTGYSPRSVQRITRKLEDRGLLISDGEGTSHTRKWRMPVPPDMGGDNLAPLTSTAPKRRQSDRGGVTPVSGGGDIAVSPKPSLTINEPSVKPSGATSDLHYFGVPMHKAQAYVDRVGEDQARELGNVLFRGKMDGTIRSPKAYALKVISDDEAP